MPKIIAQISALLALLVILPGSLGAQQPDRPPSLSVGDAVVSGFSGTLAPDPTKPRPASKSAVDLTFINLDGPSARIVGLGQPGFVWDGRLLMAPKTFDVFAKDVGQVFGIALDDQTPPNVYLAASSAFGLQIVGRGRDGLPERRKKGAPGAGWMKGQFGLELQGGPGSVYKVDGGSGVVSLLANVTLDGVPNPGPGLGNLAYDAAHKQLFVSDLYTGMVHRVGLDGKDLGSYDHGVTGLGAAKLPPVPFNPRSRPNIASDRFDSESPGTWGFAPPGRQVWGLAVHDGRLYYAVAAGPQIWSVGIQQDGGFAADPRWELDVPAQSGPLPVSDITFSQKGAMILAQRAPIAASYDYSTFTRPSEPQVLRFWLRAPNDPPSPGRWKPVPEEYAVGFAGNYRNSNGGVALGYGYGADGMLSTAACEAALWTTGQNLRNNPALRSQLEPGGPFLVHGLQGSPADMVRNANAPPATSYFIDYDDKFDDPRASGHLGSVRVYMTPCAPAVAVSGPTVAASPAGIGGGAGGGGGGGGGVCTPTCVCPPGTVLEGKECVKGCPPPQVLDPATGACKCPPGTVLSGRECVPIKSPAISCQPPLVLDPNTGLCVPAWNECVPPLVFDPITRTCVPPKHECVPPLVLDPVTGACMCPQGSVMEGGKCVPQICPPPMVPGPCLQTGSLIVIKKVVNKTRGNVTGYTYPVTVNCGGVLTPLILVDGVPQTVSPIALGTVCSVTENATPPVPPNACPIGNGTVPVWSVSISAPVMVGVTPGTITVTDELDCVKKDLGTLSVTKTISPDPKGIALTLTFPMTVTCTNPSASYPLNVHGNTSTVPFNLPVGSHCTVTETLPALPKGCTWLAPNFSPASVTIAGGLNQEIVTNGYQCSDVCPPPQVMNAAGICVCPPPMVTGPIPGTCVCPPDTTLVDGKCVPTPKCQLPQVMNAAGICVCPPPMVTGPVPGTCVCPPDTTLVNGKCVPTPKCQPPMVLNAAGVCGCPQGTVQKGNECVRPIVCRSPLVPNAAGTECVCRSGTVLRGGKCVEPVVCREPAKLNRNGTGCACPTNMVPKGNSCVERERKQRVAPERNPDIRIPGIGFPGTGGPRGGQGGPVGPGGGGGGLPGRR